MVGNAKSVHQVKDAPPCAGWHKVKQPCTPEGRQEAYDNKMKTALEALELLANLLPYSEATEFWNQLQLSTEPTNNTTKTNKQTNKQQRQQKEKKK